MSAIDLKPFCALKWDIREGLHSPWQDGKWVYATNGHMILRAPQESAPNVPSRTSAQPNNAPAMFRRDLDDVEGEFLLFPPLPETTKCEVCNGRGYSMDGEECGICLGRGVRWTFFALGDSGYDLHYLHLLAALPQARIRTNGKRAAAVLFDGGQALLMPMRPDATAATNTTSREATP